MGWSAVIAAILQVVGPLVAERLKKWLDDRLKAVTAGRGGDVEVGAAATADLLAEVYAGLWFLESRKKRFVKSLQAVAPAAVARGYFTPTEAASVRTAAVGV